MSFWVATEICTQPEIKNRVRAIEKFIQIARKCFKLQNFNTTLAIVSGLNLVSVSRLKISWEAVDPKRMKQLHGLEDLMTPIGNYKAYRAYIENLDLAKPFIPVISLILKDILFANDGNPTYLNNSTEKLINFSKIRGIFDRVSAFSISNHSNLYPRLEDGSHQHSVEEYCNNLRGLKEQHLYKYSLLCEPKQGDDALRLRTKWMNGDCT